MLFSGDFVFVGDVGRPDLLEKAVGLKGTEERGARQVWESLEIFRSLPDFIQVWPAHGAGSACGKALGSLPSSTVGYEKKASWPFRLGREDFMAELLQGQPEPPRYFAMMKKLNREKRKLLPVLPRVPELDLPRLDVATADGAVLLDVRDRKAFAAAHVPGSINIPLAKSLSTWAGWLLDYDRDVVLVADVAAVEPAQRALARIGLDRLVGFLPGVAAWRAAGRRLAQVPALLPADAHRWISEREALLLDVRAQSEYEALHIGGAIHIHGGMLRDRAALVPKDRPVILYCQSGGRSAIAASTLKALGYEQVHNLEGGLEGWLLERLPVETAARTAGREG
jgi:hydroxyacylglutathione hydrolase